MQLYRTFQDPQECNQNCCLLNHSASRTVHVLQLGRIIRLFQNLEGCRWGCLQLGPWTLRTDGRLAVRGLKTYIMEIFQDLWGHRQEFHCSNRDAYGQWLVGVGATYRTFSWSLCVQLWMSPTGSLFWQDCWKTVARKGWSPVTHPFQNLQSEWVWRTYLQGLLDHAWVGLELAQGHFRVHSWDRGLCIYSLMHRGHDFSWVSSMWCWC